MSFPDDMREILNSQYIRPNTTEFDLFGPRLLVQQQGLKN